MKIKVTLICAVVAGLLCISGCGNEWKQNASLEYTDNVTGESNDEGERKREPGSIREKKIWTESELRFCMEPKEVAVKAEGGVCKAISAANGSLELLVPEGFVKQVLEISVLEYPDSKILLQQGNTCVILKKGSREMLWGLDRQVLGCEPFSEGEIIYLPLEAVCKGFGYRLSMTPESRAIHLEDRNAFKSRRLPISYDYRKIGRSTKVRDQGSYGTCWSFASLTAIETALNPRLSREFSADHMSLHNSFSLEQREGGEYTMSMAYLLAWQGPVLEAEDPYGDGVSPDGLNPAVHVQEIQILPSKDYRAIKKAVFLNGGVQSSLYTSITGSESRSVYYNEETSSYCYLGDEIPNHDVVIVGWDDEYPKENFQMAPEKDGAFLCVSSWGEAFGDKGYFYVSYYDSNIGGNSLVYTGIESSDNYETIYQSDLCGWVGQVGYGSETAYGANIYKAEEKEILKAAGFYAAGDNTSYEIFLVHHIKGSESLETRNLVAKGTVRYSGFYTIPLEKTEELEPGERFALILKAVTPGAVHPMAVEYQADDATAEADVSDGESYISSDGIRWEPLEERYQCNLCLKGYTIRAVQ